MDKQTLLEAGALKAGSYYKLAKELGLSEGNINAWRNNKKPMSIETQADIAAYAGLSVEAVIKEALIEQTTGTPRGDRLKRALGKARGAAETICLVLCASAAGVAGLVANPTTMYRKVSWRTDLSYAR